MKEEVCKTSTGKEADNFFALSLNEKQLSVFNE